MHDAFKSCRLYILAGRQKFGEAIFSKCLAQLRKQKRTVEHPQKRIHFSRVLKLRLYADQQGKCASCKEGIALSQMEGDHRIALAQGGSNHPSNYQLLCRECNRSKGANDLARESKRLGKTIVGIIQGGN